MSSEQEARVLQLGDVCIVRKDKENFPAEFREGAKVTVVGFRRNFVGRTDRLSAQAGVYSMLDVPIVDVNGKSGAINSKYLRLLDGTPIAKPDYRNSYSKRIGDLPETPFWEGDTVEWIEGANPFVVSHDLQMEVLKIEFMWADEDSPENYATTKISDPTMLNYMVGLMVDGLSAGSTNVRAGKLNLVKRGNVWNYYHGIPLEFNSIEEEARFYHLIGRTTEVKNKDLNLYCFTKEEAIEAIRRGEGDCMYIGSNVLYLKMPRPSVYKFQDVLVGARVRATFLEGFKDYNTSVLAPESVEILKWREEHKAWYEKALKDPQ